MAKGHVNNVRKQIGELWNKAMIIEAERNNKKSEIKTYNEAEPNFELYKPKVRK